MARPALPRIRNGLRVLPMASARRGFLSRSRQPPSGRVIENLNLQRLSQESRDYHRNRQTFLLAGTAAGVISFAFTAWKLKEHLTRDPIRQDSGLQPTEPSFGLATGRKVIVHDDQGQEIVPTGNSVVPDFPRMLCLPNERGTQPSESVRVVGQPPDLTADSTEYTLVGLGLRTVSFLGIQVYVVGYYIATADIAALQAALIKKINPIATTLVPTERDQLRAQLLDAVEGPAIWNDLLKDCLPSRSLFRIVPVRDTDFHHLRDGFVRAIQARSDESTSATTTSLPSPRNDLGDSVRQFRALFNRGSVPKKKELLLHRDAAGRLSVVYDNDGNGGKGNPGGRQIIGSVDDERISRALWLNYLAGKKVASESARRSIVEGVMEFVERPVGTVATQVLAVVP